MSIFKYIYTVNYSIHKPAKRGTVPACAPYIVSVELRAPLELDSNEYKKVHMMLTKAHDINPALLKINDWVLKRREIVPLAWLKGQIKSVFLRLATLGGR